MIDITLALWKEDPPTWDVELNLSHRAPDGSQMLVGRRNLRLKADACENLLAPLVFIVTLTIDPNAAQRPEPARVEPMPAAAPAKAAEPIATQAVPKWRLALGVGIGSGWGTVPNLSALGHLRFMLSRQSWPAFAINLGYQRSSDVFHDAPSPREADVAFSASNVGLELLPQIWKQIYLLAALSCQTVSAGGAEFNRSQDGRTYGCSTGAGVLGLMPITARTSLFLRTEAGLAWQRARYTFMSASGTTEQGYRSSPILLTLAAGLSFSF